MAFQISEQFEALGSAIGVKTVVLVGGMDPMQQALVLGKKPHIIVGKLFLFNLEKRNEQSKELQIFNVYLEK